MQREVPGPVAVIGLGLMGGSLGLALGRLGGVEVRGWDPDPAARAQAQEMGVVGHATASPSDAAEGARAVFVAAPVAHIAEAARAVLAAAPEDCVISDLGSAKASIVDALRPQERERFIGGHPVCGGERSGLAAAREDLYRGATWFLTPTAEARAPLFQRLHGLVAALGARPVAIEAAVHDRLMALVSHLPHVLAATLIHQAAATTPGGREALRSAGPSFHDLTRVAGANPPLWADILIANAAAVGDAMRDHRRRLERVEEAIAAGDREWLVDYVADAARGRERLRAGDGAAPPGRPWTIAVGIPNRPGVISDIATALGHAHINIEDLSLVPGPPDGMGELVIAVDGRETAAAAARLVAQRGYRARALPA
ncbi:MAG TPA: prephenate dehydrogenase/arogenate dehydrogenase family protein [Miltoncostaeaceae bacterium]|nr:prephenate dehydrogenase/arogenate dehydrogenase family protein [Miltoncostaeaceae bacterium]